MSLLILDPTSEDAANVQIDISAGSYALLEHRYPAPPLDATYASSTDTEGAALASLTHRNRTLSVKVDVSGLTALRNLEQKVAKFNREGGTVKHLMSDAVPVVFDVVSVPTFNAPFDEAHYAGITSVDLEIECKPYGRGASSTYTLRSETTLPVLIFTETSVPGDVPALGTLTINEADADDQKWLIWGLQSRYYSSAATAALFYQAEALTPVSPSTATTRTGASGSGNTVISQASVGNAYRGIVSTQATGGGSHMTHIGDFNVWARVQVSGMADGETASFAFDWATGDFIRSTQNDPVTFNADEQDVWQLVDLGQIHIPKVRQGAQRWLGQIVAKSDGATATVWVDWLMLVPISEGSGVISANPTTSRPTTLGAQDGFNQAAGNLNAKTAPIGGNWATSGGATDLAVDATNHIVTRATTSDADLRYAVLGSSTYGDLVAQVDVKFSEVANSHSAGILLRWTDVNNYASFQLVTTAAGPHLQLDTAIGGALFTSFEVPVPFTIAADVWYTLRISVDAAGRSLGWLTYQGGTFGEPTLATTHADLAAGGTLATGKIGFVDHNASAVATTRSYDNFVGWAPAKDAAIFASQSTVVSYDGVLREDASGSVYAVPSSYEGDYLLVPPAGREGRSVRFVVKASRNIPGLLEDSGIDDISAQLTVIPRYLVVAE